MPEAAARIALRLEDDEQRRLAARLCHQDEVSILLVDRAGNWLAQISLELAWDTRVLISGCGRGRAADRQVRCVEGGRHGVAVRPADDQPLGGAHVRHAARPARPAGLWMPMRAPT